MADPLEHRAVWDALFALTEEKMRAMGWPLHPAWPAPGWDKQTQTWDALFLGPARDTDLVTLALAYGPRLGLQALLRQYNWPGAATDIAAIGTDLDAWHAAASPAGTNYRVLGLTRTGGWVRRHRKPWRINRARKGKITTPMLTADLADLARALDTIPALILPTPTERGLDTYTGQKSLALLHRTPV